MGKGGKRRPQKKEKKTFPGKSKTWDVRKAEKEMEKVESRLAS